MDKHRRVGRACYREDGHVARSRALRESERERGVSHLTPRVGNLASGFLRGRRESEQTDGQVHWQPEQRIRRGHNRGVGETGTTHRELLEHDRGNDVPENLLRVALDTDSLGNFGFVPVGGGHRQRAGGQAVLESEPRYEVG